MGDELCGAGGGNMPAKPAAWTGGPLGPEFPVKA